MSNIDQQLKTLEERIQQLVDQCDQYKRQNRTLRTREAQLLEERAQLLKKNDQARVKIEAMISRLKSMEQDT
jgi:cell division protein ZapB